jgi:hypothetical protein
MVVRTFRSANIYSDHFMVVSQICCRISNIREMKGVKVARYECGKLKYQRQQESIKRNKSTIEED